MIKESVLHLEGRGSSPLTASICFAEVSLSKILSVSATDPVVSVEEGDLGGITVKKEIWETKS